MRSTYKIIAVAAITIWPAVSSAITLTNRDATEQKLTVIEGDKQSERIVKPGEKIEICPQSCVIRMVDGEDYEFDGPETVSLEEGLLFLDGADEQPKAAH